MEDDTSKRLKRVWGRDAVVSGDCLLWPYSPSPAGYGRVWIDGASRWAHQYAYEVAYGPAPRGMMIDHACHNRACVNPDHLRLATAGENTANRRGATKSSRLGVRNVSRSGSKFEVRVKSQGKIHYCGVYETLDEARKVAARERSRLFGDFAGRG